MRLPRAPAMGVALVLGCGWLSACGGGRDHDPDFGTTSRSLEGVAGSARFDAELRSCTEGVAAAGHLQPGASIMPVEYRPAGGAQPQDSSWAPGIVNDVAPVGEALAVLDGANGSIAILSADFSHRTTVGRRGGGPGEFQQAVALAYDASTNAIIAFDGGSSRLSYFAADGRFIRSVPADVPAVSDIAASGGESGFAHHLIPELIGQDPRLGRLVSVQRAGESDSRPELSVSAQSDLAEWLILPGPTAHRLQRAPSGWLLISPVAGRVALVKGGRITHEIAVCMPESLRRAYRRQLESHRRGEGGSSQQSIGLISDAMMVGDTIYTVGPLTDQEGRFHVDRYLLNGESLGSWVAPVGSLRYPQDIRFWGGPRDLVAFGSRGTIMRLRLEVTP